jgi:Mycothiol maleylpyruvate isomerase N-terminal domain
MAEFASSGGVSTNAGVTPAEVTEFLDTLDSNPANALTACTGRTAHLLGAHMAGSYKEIARHVEAYMSGSPLARTRTFDEREAEFRAMSAPQLLSSIADREQRMRIVIGELLEREPDPVLRWTGRQVHAREFLKHSRSECAIHQWDLAGDGAVSDKLLSQQELFEHVVNFIGALPMTARGTATGAGTGRSLQARVRAYGQPDLLVVVHRGEPQFLIAEPEGDALVEGDPAARLLFMWGRRPTPYGRLSCHGSPEELSRLQWLLSGY